MSRALAACLLLLCGCDLNGRDLVYPGASVYQPTSKDFHFHYLAPPWTTGVPGPGAMMQLTVPATEQAPDSTGSSHILQVLYVSAGSPRAAAELERQSMQQGGGTLLRDLTSIVALTGEPGWDLQARKDVGARRAYFRESFYSSATGQVVRFSLLAAYPTDEVDIEDLILSFSAGPDPGTPGPEKVK